MTAPPDKYSIGDIIDGKAITWLTCPLYYTGIGWLQLAHFNGEQRRYRKSKYRNATVLFYETTNFGGLRPSSTRGE